MKLFLATLSGFVITLAIFTAGAICAVYFTNAEPVPVWGVDEGAPSVWTVEPVAASAQPFERLPAKALPKTSAGAKVSKPPLVDMTTTGAVPDQNSDTTHLPATDEVTTTAHVEWCSERFRSYRPEDNSYRSYSGSRRECISPFNGRVERHEDDHLDYADQPANQANDSYAMNEEEPAAYLTPGHVASCFSRYRSYRPEDNSYQPYGGGPRRPCE